MKTAEQSEKLQRSRNYMRVLGYEAQRRPNRRQELRLMGCGETTDVARAYCAARRGREF